MLARTAPATVANAAKEGKEAPGDTAGGPSAAAGTSADMAGAGESVERTAEKTFDAPVSEALASELLSSKGKGEGSSQGEIRTSNAGSGAVAAADCGGGHVADSHSSVRFEEQAQAAGYERSTPRTPSHAGNAATSQEDAERETPQPLIIPPDATLVDGLRALLVHHLKRSVGSSVLSLSASQAELLEHHLARLASYAQKIVHTLAFATRFLTKQQYGDGGGDGYPSDPQIFAAGGGQNAQYRPGEGNMMYGAQTAQQPVQQEPKAPRKSLKLSDDEILSIYRSAQEEAATEADWRGIDGPAAKAEGEAPSRSVPAAPPPGPQPSPGADQEYLQMLSRALQEPGRSQALTAEILDPSKGVVCCRPGAAPPSSMPNTLRSEQ